MRSINGGRNKVIEGLAVKGGGRVFRCSDSFVVPLEMLIEKVRVEVLGVSPLPDQFIVPLFLVEKFVPSDTIECRQNPYRDTECKEIHSGFRPNRVKQPMVYFDLVTYNNK